MIPRGKNMLVDDFSELAFSNYLQIKYLNKKIGDQEAPSAACPNPICSVCLSLFSWMMMSKKLTSVVSN